MCFGAGWICGIWPERLRGLAGRFSFTGGVKGGVWECESGRWGCEDVVGLWGDDEAGTVVAEEGLGMGMWSLWDLRSGEMDGWVRLGVCGAVKACVRYVFCSPQGQACCGVLFIKIAGSFSLEIVQQVVHSGGSSLLASCGKVLYRKHATSGVILVGVGWF